MNIVVLIVTLLITALLLAIGYWWYRKNKPVHSFIGVDFGANSIQPRRIKNLFGPFKVKRNDGQKVQFPVPAGYHMPRQDGKGNLFFGDLSTGQLFKPHREPDKDGKPGNIVLDFAHGIFLEKALSDGRVGLIVSSTKGSGGIKLEHVAILVGITLLAVIVSIYMYARMGGVAIIQLVPGLF